MAKQVFAVAWVVVIAAKADVALFVHVDLKGVPRRHDHPDSHVEFSVHYKQRVLDVFLDDPLSVMLEVVITLGTGGRLVRACHA